jgi:hypothetical protein
VKKLDEGRIMKSKIKQSRFYRDGSVLVLIVVSMIILAALGAGLLTVSYGVRHRAIALKNEAAAMLAAEAGYETAAFWMSQQADMLSALQDGREGTSETLQFEDSRCDYEIRFYSFIGARPVYKIVSTGHSGSFRKTVDVLVLQAIGGWDMGMCRVPIGRTSTYAVNYADGEIIDMPLHINNLNDNPDNRDIYIIGNPQFLREVGMGESRYRGGGGDKYGSVMGFFDGGICFDQPDSRITDEDAVAEKVERFEESTDSTFTFEPIAGAGVSNPLPAVHLEFFVEDDVGKVRITNNSTVRGFQQSSDSRTWDFKVNEDAEGEYERYHIYGYHLMSENADSTGERTISRIEDSYVTQSIGGVESEPGGQIFVEGNVVIGSGDVNLPGIQDAVKGKITVVATGNIWLADSVVVDGEHEANGKPSQDNPNVLGLIAQGVVKVVDPGMSDYAYVDGTPEEPEGFKYVPIGRVDGGHSPGSHRRHLPDPMEVEAAITVGGGGWGAENVRRGSYGGRKEDSGNQDDLIVRGTLAEAVRGVVGLVGNDGYRKQYYLDERLLQGVLPGDMWLQGKYVAAPAGWHDYRSTGN